MFQVYEVGVGGVVDDNEASSNIEARASDAVAGRLVGRAGEYVVGRCGRSRKGESQGIGWESPRKGRKVDPIWRIQAEIGDGRAAWQGRRTDILFGEKTMSNKSITFPTRVFSSSSQILDLKLAGPYKRLILRLPRLCFALSSSFSSPNPRHSIIHVCS